MKTYSRNIIKFLDIYISYIRKTWEPEKLLQFCHQSSPRQSTKLCLYISSWYVPCNLWHVKSYISGEGAQDEQVIHRLYDTSPLSAPISHFPIGSTLLASTNYISVFVSKGMNSFQTTVLQDSLSCMSSSTLAATAPSITIPIVLQ